MGGCTAAKLMPPPATQPMAFFLPSPQHKKAPGEKSGGTAEERTVEADWYFQNKIIGEDLDAPAGGSEDAEAQQAPGIICSYPGQN